MVDHIEYWYFFFKINLNYSNLKNQVEKYDFDLLKFDQLGLIYYEQNRIMWDCSNFYKFNNLILFELEFYKNLHDEIHYVMVI